MQRLPRFCRAVEHPPALGTRWGMFFVFIFYVSKRKIISGRYKRMGKNQVNQPSEPRPEEFPELPQEDDGVKTDR